MSLYYEIIFWGNFYHNELSPTPKFIFVLFSTSIKQSINILYFPTMDFYWMPIMWLCALYISSAKSKIHTCAHTHTELERRRKKECSIQNRKHITSNSFFNIVMSAKMKCMLLWVLGNRITENTIST